MNQRSTDEKVEFDDPLYQRLVEDINIEKLSPTRRVGQMMGIWFVGAALGNLFAGLVAGQLENMLPTDLFRTVAMIIGGVGIIALLASQPVKKMMGGRE